MTAPFSTSASLDYDFQTTPGNVMTSAQGKITETLADIAGFKLRSEELYTQAMNQLKAAYAFVVPELPEVTFPFEMTDFNEVTLGPAVTFPSGLFLDHTFSGAIGDAPTMEVADFERSSFAPPSASDYVFDDSPPPLPSSPAPAGPAAPSVRVPEAPSLSFELLPVLDAGSAPALPPLMSEDLPLLDIEPIDLGQLDLPDESSLQQMEAMINRRFRRNAYFEKMMPVTMTAVGSLLNNGFVLDTAELADGFLRNIDEALRRHDEITGSVWTRRRLQGNENAAGYNARVRERVYADAQNDWDVAVDRMRMRIMPSLLQIATEAHAFQVEMEGELYDLDFEFISAELEATRSLFALAVARYNLQLTKMRTYAIEYRAQVAQVVALADRYRALTQQATAKGRANAALAAGYSAEQRARAVEADAFSANVDAARAIVQAYDAQMQALEVEARTKRADLLSFQATVAEWEGQVDAARREYQRNRAENRGIIAQNRARAAQMEVGAAQQEGIAEQARASAIEAVALSSQLVAEAVNRGGRLSQREFENIQESAIYQAAVAGYRAEAAQATSDLSQDNEINRAASQINASTAATFGQVSRNAIRAAELTQQYRIQLTQALDSLYNAIGSADAARVAGELSRFRASLGLRATGELSFASQVSKDAQYSWDVTNAGSNTSRTEWVAAEEG